MKFKQFYLMEYSYSCIMLLLPENITKNIKKFISENIDESILYKGEGEGGLSKHIHTTVKYGLDETNFDVIKELLSKYKDIKFKLKNITKFDSDDKYDVIKIDIDSKELRDMNKHVSKTVQCTDTFKEYKPHVTLAYVKKGKCDELINNSKFNGVGGTMNKVYFTTPDDKEYFSVL